MTSDPPCPLCAGGPLVRHGSRQVDVAVVEGDRLAWGHANVARVICRACGRTSGRGAAEADALIDIAHGFVTDVFAERGMRAAMEASGLTDRTVERWVSTVTEERLAEALPPAIVLGILGRLVVASDASDGRALDASHGDEGDVAELLSRRGGGVCVVWIWPALRIRHAVERALPDAEVRMPPAMARERLDALLGMVDVPRGPGEARLLSERVCACGWDDGALRLLQGMHRSLGGAGDTFLTLWRDEILAGIVHPDPAPMAPLPAGTSLVRLRAMISMSKPKMSEQKTGL